MREGNGTLIAWLTVRFLPFNARMHLKLSYMFRNTSFALLSLLQNYAMNFMALLLYMHISIRWTKAPQDSIYDLTATHFGT